LSRSGPDFILKQFQKIFALSVHPSWRTRGLEAAATLTNLTIEIPKHPYTSDELARAFEQIGPENVDHPPNGSALAWLAHLDMLKFVIASDLDTTLIIEDDVDWDIAIKGQMSLISDAVRNFTRVDANEPAPYGRSWDILWPGHCGEVTDPGTPRLEFEDTTSGRPAAWQLYAGWSKMWMQNIREGYRVTQKAKIPVCTFGYAVTREGAQKVLEFAGRGQFEAFDVAISNGCKTAKLDCLIVNPEVMHHYNPPDGYGYVSSVFQGDGKGVGSTEEAFEKIKGTTANMIRSARCEALFNEVCPQPPTP